MIVLPDPAWIETGIHTLALVGGGFAFGIGLLQYQKAQRWKRAEWVSNEVRLFENDPMVACALQMVDYGRGRKVCFPSQRELIVTDATIAEALRLHSRRESEPFTDDEALIRDAFDALLSGFSRFQHLIDAGLIELADIRPYFNYWMNSIGKIDEGSDCVERLKQLLRYMVCYQYNDVSRLLVMFGLQDPRHQSDADSSPVDQAALRV
jgi:hypothetical protein